MLRLAAISLLIVLAEMLAASVWHPLSPMFQLGEMVRP
jgi:hypothetical protein